MMMTEAEAASAFEAVVRDHGGKPYHKRVPEHFDVHASAEHPISGEHFTIYVQIDGDLHIEAVYFDGQGTRVSQASASAMASLCEDVPIEKAEQFFGMFHSLVNGAPGDPVADGLPELMRAFAGLRKYPVRVPCALLGWRALVAALAKAKKGKWDPDGFSG